MTCPFLKEAQVRYCRTAAIRKLIPLALTGRADEKCSSAEHASCVVSNGEAMSVIGLQKITFTIQG